MSPNGPWDPFTTSPGDSESLLGVAAAGLRGCASTHVSLLFRAPHPAAVVHWEVVEGEAFVSEPPLAAIVY